MTDCNRDTLRFSTLGTRAVVADFRGGRLTTDAGALLLREVADSTGLFEALNAAIPDPRNPLMVTHAQQTMIAQRITAIALGYEDLCDHHDLRRDPVLQLAAGKAPDEDDRWLRRRLSAAWKTASTARPCSASPRSSSISSSPRIPLRPST